MQFGASESILHWGKYRPHSQAILHNGRSLSYGQFNEHIDRVGAAVSALNHDGERVALAAKSKLDFFVSLVAVLRCGKSAVLVNTGLTDDALRTNLLDTEVSLLIHDESHKRISTLTTDRIQMNTLHLEDDFGLPDKVASLQPVERVPGDEWGVLFSSGTTGTPKGIERDQNSMVTEFLGWCLELGLTRHTKFYVGRPIYYTGGLVLSMATLIVGGQIIINDFANDNDPDEVWRDYQQTLRRTKIDWAFFVPDQIRAFVKIAKKTKPSAAGSILVMGAPISGDEKVNASEQLGSKVVESWGNTESLGTITDPEDLDTRPDSIGRPFLTDELYVVDDDCNVLDSKQIGRIAGSEEAGFLKYSNRPRETEIAKRERLIVSEDVGYTDSDGYFYVCGRQQECLVIGGETVFIPSIEQKIREHADVEECCVSPTGDEMSVQLVAILVTSETSSIDEANLLPSINNLLGQNEKLARIVVVESIPRVLSGKPDRVAITQLVEKN